MSERLYFFFIGAIILLGLYIENDYVIYGVTFVLIFEGITDWRLPVYIQKLRKVKLDAGLVLFDSKQRISIDAFRAWRVLVSLVLLSTYILVHQYNVELLWFFPWFLGFAVMGAGGSGVCPVVLLLRWVGFK